MNDLISRQAAIAEFSCCELTPDGGIDANYALDFLEQLPSTQPEPHWIPCSERLPEDDTEVFVYLFDRQYPYIAWVTDSCWFTEDFQVEKENYPKAWMPLPEPYKEDKKRMSDYISRKTAMLALIKKGQSSTRYRLSEEWELNGKEIREALDGIPTADVRENVHGEWEKMDMHRGMEQYKCSECEAECYVPECMGEPMYLFCPNCGADMRRVTK